MRNIWERFCSRHYPSAEAKLRKCTKEQFCLARYVLVGAEKLRDPIAKTFADARLICSKGVFAGTEMSPVIAVNGPSYLAGRDSQMWLGLGTVGPSATGVLSDQIVNPDTGEPLPPDQEGLILVRGANLMRGYLGQPERTAEVIEDGWYRTMIWASSTKTAFSGSRIAFRGSANSAARWSRI